MSVTILTYVLGPLENKTYLVADTETGQAALVDPSFGIETLWNDIERRGWSVEQIWLTHAHFDHIIGVNQTVQRWEKARIALHKADLALYHEGGEAALFGLPFETGPEPEIWLEQDHVLKVGQSEWEVRHTPGHTPGHVIFYCAQSGTALCGDLIFSGSVGRTDLTGGDEITLLASIRQHVLPLPGKTRLLPGHGPATTVEVEAATNPYLR